MKGIKKIVLFIRFIETASKQIAECNGAFENLPPASQTALLNAAFAGDYLGVPDLLAFSNRIKEYFKLSPLFMRMHNNWEAIDGELKEHCHVIKMQRVSPNELAQYYIEYMKRHALEPDPKVKNKLDAGEYSKDMTAGYGAPSLNNQFLCPAELEREKMKQLQQQLNHNAMQNGMPPNTGGFNQNQGFGGGYQQQHHQQQRPHQFNNNQFAQPQQPFGNNQFGQPNQFTNNQFGQPNNQFNNNQFAQPQQQHQPPQNNFFNNQNMQQTHQPQRPPQAYQPPQGQPQAKINESNPFAQGLGHDDIFGAEQQQNNPGFGGAKGNQPGAGGTGDGQFDDFINQLNDLRDL